MDNEIRVSSTKKVGEGVPSGAEILSQTKETNVREIENGFILVKRIETKYKTEDGTDWDYSTKEYFSKKNPLKIKLDDKSLADSFDED